MRQPFEPTLYTVHGRDLALSGATLLALARAVLGRGVTFRFCAKGYSMAPFIRDGDVVSVAPLSGRPGLGQVVAFVHASGNQLVVHRVVGHRGSDYFIQGDALHQADGLVPLAAILGRVTSVERGGHSVRLGLGIERRFIALLHRGGLLWRSAWCLGRFLRRIGRALYHRISHSAILFWKRA